MNPIIPRETLAALKAGDHKAYETVFLAYYKKILAFTKVIIRCEEDAEEITQEIFVRLWVTRESLDLDRSVNALLYTMARNDSYNYLKHKIVRETYEAENPLIEELPSFEGELYAEEARLLIEMEIVKLPEQRGRIFTLSKLNGLTNDEIATQLNITKKTVENQLSMALKAIRKAVLLFITTFFFS